MAWLTWLTWPLDWWCCCCSLLMSKADRGASSCNTRSCLRMLGTKCWLLLLSLRLSSNSGSIGGFIGVEGKGVAGIGKTTGNDGSGGADKAGQQVPPEVYNALTYAGIGFLFTLSVPAILYLLNSLLNKIEDLLGCGPASRPQTGSGQRHQRLAASRKRPPGTSESIIKKHHQNQHQNQNYQQQQKQQQQHRLAKPISGPSSSNKTNTNSNLSSKDNPNKQTISAGSPHEATKLRSTTVSPDRKKSGQCELISSNCNQVSLHPYSKQEPVRASNAQPNSPSSTSSTLSIRQQQQQHQESQLLLQLQQHQQQLDLDLQYQDHLISSNNQQEQKKRQTNYQKNQNRQSGCFLQKQEHIDYSAPNQTPSSESQSIGSDQRRAGGKRHARKEVNQNNLDLNYPNNLTLSISCDKLQMHQQLPLQLQDNSMGNTKTNHSQLIEDNYQHHDHNQEHNLNGKQNQNQGSDWSYSNTTSDHRQQQQHQDHHNKHFTQGQHQLKANYANYHQHDRIQH